MASSSRGLSLLQGQATRVAEPFISSRPKGVVPTPAERLLEEFTQSLPCVIYECDPSMELTFLSGNVVELFGFEPKELLGTRMLWEERVAPQDLDLFRQKFSDLKKVKSISLIHRLLNRTGMPVWVSHGLRSFVSAESGEVIRGCLLGLGSELKIPELWQSTVDRFIHKIGNHFQILHLVINSLNKVLPKSRETDVLQNTVDALVDLARLFSEYNQAPSCWLRMEFSEILKAALIRWQPAFIEKGVALEEETDPSSEKAFLEGDPFLLELALGHILQNALEATERGGKVSLHSAANFSSDAAPSVTVRVRDSGAGIEKKNLAQILAPFFTTKEGHAGLGLSMASRFVDMHSGCLTIESETGKGTEVVVELPLISTDVTASG